MKQVTMYTDGACKGNPGLGGYGVVLLYKDYRKELSQGFRKTTNNRMELMAVTTGLRALKIKCNVTVYSDSKYVVDAINSGWLEKWQKSNWKRNGNKPVMNTDLWKELNQLMSHHNVKFKWVKGHSDNIENERCDLLAVAAAESTNLSEDVYFMQYEKST